jgi:hypothetical protein
VAVAHANNLRHFEIIDDAYELFGQLGHARILSDLEIGSVRLQTWQVNVNPDGARANVGHLLTIDKLLVACVVARYLVDAHDEAALRRSQRFVLYVDVKR